MLGYYKNPEETNDDTSVIILTSDEMIAGLRNQTIVRFEVWNKLWKKELIGDVRFKKGQVCEDIYFDHVLFLKANKMVHINTSLHNYLISRPGNTNSSFRRAKLEGVKELHAFVDDLQSCDKKELASMIAAYGAEFTILVYLGTKKSKQDKMYMQTVIDEHKFFRKKAWGSGYENRKALLLFAISPWLYGKVLGLKERKMH